MKKLVTLMAVLASGTALAHSGHTASEALHGLWHAEHILLLLAVGVAAGVAVWLKR